MKFVSSSEAWDNTYFYDGTGASAYTTVAVGSSAANVYRAQKDVEELKAVSVAVQSTDVTFDVQVYKSSTEMTNPLQGTAQLSQPVRFKTSSEGIYNIKLPQPVRLRRGEYFSVVFTVADCSDSYACLYFDKSADMGSETYINTCGPNQSFYIVRTSSGGASVWDRSSSGCFRIKAFTDDSELKSCRITYVTNGGSLPSENPQTYTEGDPAVTLKSSKKTGYTFKGWYSDKTYQTKVTKITNLQNDLTLYARWTAHKYTVKFYGNGATEGTTQTQSFTYNSKKTLKKNAFKKKGYTFAGWNTKADGSGKTYADGVDGSRLTSTNGATVKLYAIWKKTSYKITYKLNGGTNSKSNPSKYTVTSKTIVYKDPTKKGYQFLGWYKDAKFTQKTKQISKGSTGSRTVYAKWKKKTYSVTYVLNGGKNSSENPSSYTVTSKITLKSPVKSGYVFDGWYEKKDFSGRKVTSLGNGSTGSRTLYAKWVKDRKYTVKYVPNGGGGSAVSQTVKYEETIRLKDNPFTYAGHVFTGWNTKADGTGTAYGAGASVSRLTSTHMGTVTLYAQWREVRKVWKQVSSGTVNYAYFPNGFDTSDYLYSRYHNTPVSGYETETAKRVVSTSESGHIFWHWARTRGYLQNDNYNVIIRDAYGEEDGKLYQYFSAVQTNAALSYYDRNGNYGGGRVVYWWDGNVNNGSWWWYQFPTYTQTYTDYVAVYE